MNDEQRSGNRWEPTAPDATAPLNAEATSVSSTASSGTATAERTHPTEPADEQVAGPTGYAAPADPADGDSWRDRLGVLRTKSAAFAAATFLVGGAGGFALGHVVAGDGDQAGRSGQQGQFGPGQRPDGFGRGDGDGRGFGDGGSQQGQQNEQQAPTQDNGQQGTTSGSTT